MLKWVSAAIAFTIMAVLPAAGQDSAAEQEAELLSGTYPLAWAGANAPNILATSGDSLDLATLRGNYVLIDFWASWCRPCIEEIPEINILAEELAQREDVVFISVNQDALTAGDAVPDLDRLIRDSGIEYPVLIDAAEPSLKRAFKVRAWPMRVLVGPDGSVLQRRAGKATLEPLAEYLRSM